jgi:hypothetical protein
VLPVNIFDIHTIDAARPGAGFAPKRVEVGDSAMAKALAANSDFRLVEPTAVSGGIVHGEALAELTAHLPAVTVSQRFAMVNVEIVHHQVIHPHRICQIMLTIL